MQIIKKNNNNTKIQYREHWKKERKKNKQTRKSKLSTPMKRYVKTKT